MKVTVEKLEKSMAKLTIEVSAEDFDKAMKQIKKLDKKILGRKNAKALHTEKSFGGKPIHLVGGTPLIIPTKIAELRTNINTTRTI